MFWMIDIYLKYAIWKGYQSKPITIISIMYYKIIKAKLQREGIFFLIHLFARDILLMEIEEKKNT